MANILSSEDFEEKVLKGKGIAVIDFYATWCGPCQMMAPIFDELATEYEGKALIAKVDVDQTPDVASKYGVMSIPTIIIFKDGEEVDKKVGALSKEQLTAAISEAL